MKSLALATFLSLFSLTTFAADWKPIAESTDCGEKVQILAKEGENFVKLVKGDHEEVLNSRSSSNFTTDDPEKRLFENKNYTFYRPAVMDSAAPKLTITSEGKSHRCTMKAK
jgi:hypothetical protein